MAELAKPLVGRSRASRWGFLVAFAIALMFAIAGGMTLDRALVPSQLGVFVEPPSWLFAAILIGAALFMALVGVGELASYLKPSIVVTMDNEGVSAFGLLGRRRLAWAEIEAVTVHQGVFTIKGRTRQRKLRRTLHIAATGLDIPPGDLMAALRVRRPDLDIPWDWRLDVPTDA